MNKDWLISKGLSPEHAEIAMSGHKSAIENVYIAKSRFDEVIEQNKTLKESLDARDTQLQSLQALSGTNEELKTKLEKFEQDNKDMKAAHEAELANLKLDTALKMHFNGKVHDVDYILSQLDKSIIRLDKDGNVKSGLDHQEAALRESKAFAWVPEDTAAEGSGKGFEVEGFSPVVTAQQKAGLSGVNPFKKESFNVQKQIELENVNPALAKQLAQEAGIF